MESIHQDADICSERQVPLPPEVHQEHANEKDSSYYTEIYNYLASQATPAGAAESYKKILKKRARKYKIMDGILCYGKKLPKRVITEKLQQKEILKKIHIEEGTGVHLGLKKMYVAVNQFYFWKGLYVDVANFVKQCNHCSETTRIQSCNQWQPQQLDQAIDGYDSCKEKNMRSGNISKVWQKVELKLHGPYPKTILENEFIITIADPLSHWIVAHPVPGSNYGSHIADFVYKTFCKFGFAKCCFVGVPQEILEAAQCKYKEYISRLQDTSLMRGLMEPQVTSICGTTVHNLMGFLLENLSQCTWVRKLLDEFVETSPRTWDLELERLLFQYRTSADKDSSSPFTIMFGRSPVSYLEEDKENHNMKDEEKPAEPLSEKRRLQSNILHCHHCEEVFISKISFRVHQRKHVEDAHCRGTLERQEHPGPAAEKEERLLERTVLKQKQKLFKHDDENKDHLQSPDKFPSQTLSVEDLLYSGNEMTSSPSCFSDIGVLSRDSDNLQNVSTPKSPQHDSTRTFQEETIKSNGNTQCQILENSPNNCQVTESGQMETSVQDLRHFDGVSIAVYTETGMPGTLQTNSKARSGDYTYKVNGNESSGIQLEVINYPLESSSWNDNQCEGGTTNKPNKSSTVSASADLSEVFYCDICGKIFLNKTRLTMHIEQHSNPLLKCTKCSYTTKSSKLLDYHQNLHTGKFKCKICNKLFTRKIYLKYHFKDIHCKTRHLHSCEECGARFMSLSGLKMHIQTVHEPLRTYSCTFCKYIGNSTNCLASHILRSHKKKYKCKICDYSSLSQTGLDRHERICHVPHDRQFACKFCPYRGLKRRQLLDHERIVHTQDKNKHVCPVCKKSFRTQVLMKHHLPSHTDLHLYSCKGCSYTARYRQTFHSHLKQSHQGESFNNLCNGPSEADFEAIISTALKALEQFPAPDEQNTEADYSAQVPENCPAVEDTDKVVDVPVLSEHLESQDLPCPQDTVNGCVGSQQNQIITLSECESPQQTETGTSTELMESALITAGVVDSAHQLNSGTNESDQAVTIIDGSGLTSDEVQTIVGLAGDFSGGKQEVCHLVTLADTDMEKTLLQLSGCNLEDKKIHRVVTLVNGLVSRTEENQHTITLLNNVMQHKSNEYSTVSVAGKSDCSQENLVILPLGDSKVAVVQNNSFSNSRLILDEQTTLLDFVAQQSELIQCQPEKSIKQVTVYKLDQ